MGDEIFTPQLTTTDWNAEWMRLQGARQRSDDAAVWDAKAKTFPVKHGSQAGYVARFIELSGIRPGESVLDMGCGTGALATPLARAGHDVIACDFSRGMLDVMIADQESLGIDNVDVRLLSWDDDWHAAGVGEAVADVAIASRSIATYDLKAALLKLDRAARRRVCITLPRSASPKADDELIAAAGFSPRVGRDFIYAFNILASLGRSPEVSYIPNTRMERFSTFDDALGAFSEIVRVAVQGLAAPEEVAEVPDRLRPWLERNLVEDADGVHLQHPRLVTWAFLAWDTGRR